MIYRDFQKLYRTMHGRFATKKNESVLYFTGLFFNFENCGILTDCMAGITNQWGRHGRNVVNCGVGNDEVAKEGKLIMRDCK